MEKLALLRKLASVVLLLCFVLPLSQCTTTSYKDGKPVTSTSTLYPSDLVRQGMNSLSPPHFDGAWMLFGVFSIFAAPVACWSMRRGRQAAVLLATSIVAGYFLVSWVFVFSTVAKVGGLLASACWIVLFATSGVVLWGRLRAWRQRRRAMLYEI